MKMIRLEKYTGKDLFHFILGLCLCTLGIVLCTKADLGLSMIAAPAYILHVALHRSLAWYTQGTGEYIFQAAMLLLMCVVIRRFRAGYLLSFFTAVLTGLLIDLWLLLLGGGGAYEALALRIITFAVGSVIISLAVALFFRTNCPLQVYELFVKQFSKRYPGFQITRVKYVYDLCMLALSFILSFALTGTLTGIGIGTVIVTVTNAPLIRLFGRLIDRTEEKYVSTATKGEKT